MPDLLDTCGRKPYPERKSCGFKNRVLKQQRRWRPRKRKFKGIRAASNFIAFIPFRLLRQMLADVNGVEF